MKLPGTFILLLAVAASASAAEWNRNYTVAGKPSVRIETNDARIRVNPGSSGQVSVRVTSTNYRIPDQVKITENQTGNSVEVRVQVPAMHIGFLGSRNTVEVDVAVPNPVDLDLHTGDGAVDVQGVKGDLRLLTGDGHIEARNIDGALRASTGDGHITIDGRFDAVEVKTNDGHIDATIRSGSRISSQWSFRSGDGRIDLHLPSDLKADLDVHTGDGHITTDLPIELQGSITRSALRGHLNGGGSLIMVRTGDGSIHIQRS